MCDLGWSFEDGGWCLACLASIGMLLSLAQRSMVCAIEGRGRGRRAQVGHGGGPRDGARGAHRGARQRYGRSA
ncbi:hypothetical protein DENSPDRAFT_452207 [Dentipellis sp. KUC8613]|nr:hypothetical protein DENSPDRAFT_452207 [Dentipellis sp. KUC8613]